MQIDDFSRQSTAVLYRVFFPQQQQQPKRVKLLFIIHITIYNTNHHVAYLNLILQNKQRVIYQNKNVLITEKAEREKVQRFSFFVFFSRLISHDCPSRGIHGQS